MNSKEKDWHRLIALYQVGGMTDEDSISDENEPELDLIEDGSTPNVTFTAPVEGEYTIKATTQDSQAVFLGLRSRGFLYSSDKVAKWMLVPESDSTFYLQKIGDSWTNYVARVTRRRRVQL